MTGEAEIVLLNSGGSIDIFPHNTLGCFRNRINTLPSSLAKDGQRVVIGVQEIGITNNFTCVAFRTEGPVLLCVLDGESLDLSNRAQTFYFQSNTRSLDGPQLNYELGRVQKLFADKLSMNGSQEVIMDENGIDQAYYRLTMQAKKKCTVFIEKTFAENFEIAEGESVELVQLESLQYCKIELDAEGTVTRVVSEYALFEKRLPQELVIESSIISQEKNSAHQVLARFVPENDGKFQRHVFKHPQFSPLKTGNLNAVDVDISILDGLTRKSVTMLAGISTYCVLKMYAVPEEKEFFYLNVSSKKSRFCETNNVHDFGIVLPSPITLSDQWRVSLHSCILPNAFATFTEDVVLSEHTRHGSKNTSTLSPSGMHIPRGRYTLKEVVSMVNSKLTSCKLKIDPQTGKAKFEAVNKMKKNSMIFLLLGYELGMYLGYSLDDRLSEVNIYQDKQGIMLTREQPSYEYRYRPHERANLAPYAMLYSSIIRGMHTSDGKSSILKILQVGGEKSNGRTAHEFEKNDFRQMNTHVIDRIHFSIRGHDGSKLPFLNATDCVNLTLYFEKTTGNEEQSVGT